MLGTSGFLLPRAQGLVPGWGTKVLQAVVAQPKKVMMELNYQGQDLRAQESQALSVCQALD